MSDDVLHIVFGAGQVGNALAARLTGLGHPCPGGGPGTGRPAQYESLMTTSQADRPVTSQCGP